MVNRTKNYIPAVSYLVSILSSDLVRVCCAYYKLSWSVTSNADYYY
ncbi:MAG: hypothetical protein LBV42_04185 [Methanobrevibacter sp.]|nr:hypothetical protein [Methanobrevibacter sp.]